MNVWAGAHLDVFTKQGHSGSPHDRSAVVPVAAFRLKLQHILKSNVQRAAKIDRADKKCLLCTSGSYFENERSFIRSRRHQHARNCLENGPSIIQCVKIVVLWYGR
jgi:hypothetical protein